MSFLGDNLNIFSRKKQEEIFISAFRTLQQWSNEAQAKKGLDKHKKHLLYVPAKLALIMSEAVEALEWHRGGKEKEIGHDLADIILRTMDLAEDLGIDLASEIVKKNRLNHERAKKKSKSKY